MLGDASSIGITYERLKTACEEFRASTHPKLVRDYLFLCTKWKIEIFLNVEGTKKRLCLQTH